MDQNTIRIVIIAVVVVLIRIIIKNIKNLTKANSKSLEYDKLIKQLNDYFNNLSQEEKEKYGKQQLTIAVLEDYDMEVNNGGLCQYFVNSSRAGAPRLSEFLKEINAKKHKKLFDDFIRKNKIDVNDLDNFIIEHEEAELGKISSVSDDEKYYEKYKSNPFDDFDSEFYNLYREENLEDLIKEYAINSFAKIFPDMNEKINIKELDVEQFAKKYEELVSLYPEYYENKSPALKTVLNYKINQLSKLNEKIKLNDDFAHEVIDILLKSKNPVILCEISVMACVIDYRKNEATEIIKKNLHKINCPSFSYHIKFALSEMCGIKIN